jgi:hypothetical protein
LHWLHGWQKWEERQETAIAIAARGFPDQTPTVDEGGAVEDFAFEDDGPEFDDLLDTDEFEDTAVEEEEPVAAGS